MSGEIGKLVQKAEDREEDISSILLKFEKLLNLKK